ncbi:MAG: hypothetical protein WBF53_15185 [Litorimonas sp.]
MIIDTNSPIGARISAVFWTWAAIDEVRLAKEFRGRGDVVASGKRLMAGLGHRATANEARRNARELEREIGMDRALPAWQMEP